ncbi:hypothetical protein [Enhygromyxa salina]|uniref:Uncharacterized protein n=1 Tax=Enhygromyxa salina TaxID=215803 RepID=A0A2S9YSU6_9BACT|nr:hypothetical protein [Enhygromyxa salina]PRQ08158.1 hypothetical protein ENSA7_21300 [Enhygromyxa salina]
MSVTYACRLKTARLEVEALETIDDLSLTIAPKVVGLIQIGSEGRSVVLIKRYEACPGEWLARSTTTKEPFSEATAVRFQADVQALASRGLVYPYLRLLMHWLVSSETGTLVVEGDWSRMRKNRWETQFMLEEVDRHLTSRSPA